MAIVTETYRVYSYDRLEVNDEPHLTFNGGLQKKLKGGVPAGEYRSLNKAIEHAETVTYRMVVLNWRDEIAWDNTWNATGHKGETNASKL